MIERSFKMKDKLTNREIAKDIVLIAWPVFVELLLSSFFGMVDMMMIGQITDPNYSAAAVASVGLTNQPYFLMVSLVQALNVGATAIISRYHGAKQYQDMENVLKHVLTLSVSCFILPLVVLTFIFAPNILLFLGAEPYTLEIAVPYFRCIMIGFLFTGVTLSVSAALRGVGETKIPMKNNLIANGVNVVLNYILIYGLFGFPALKLLGTGIATLIANALAMTLMFSYLLRGKSKIKFHLFKPFKIQLTLIKRLVKLGIPSAMEQLLFRLGAITFTVIVAQLGTVVYAAHQIGLNLWSLSISPSQAFGIAASTLTGKNIGAKNIANATRYVNIIRKMAFCVALIMGTLFYFFSPLLASGYTSSQDIIHMVMIIAPILAIIQPFLAEQIVLAGTLRGAGDTIWPMIATVLGVFVVRTALAYYFVQVLNVGLIGAWWALLGNQLVSSFIVWLRYGTGKWKHIQI